MSKNDRDNVEAVMFLFGAFFLLAGAIAGLVTQPIATVAAGAFVLWMIREAP